MVVYDIQDLSNVTLGNNIYTYLDYNAVTPNTGSADLLVFDQYTNTNNCGRIFTEIIKCVYKVGSA